jgi:hypothetical protein
MPFSDFLQNILEEQPELPFFAGVGGLRSPQQRRFFQGQFPNIFNEFLGRLGGQIQSGQTPNLRFTDFLSETPFTQRFASTPPSFRGDFQSRFAPRTRSFFF